MIYRIMGNMGNTAGAILVVPYKGGKKRAHLKWKVEVPRSLDPKRPRKFFLTKPDAEKWKSALLAGYHREGASGLKIAGELMKPLVEKWKEKKINPGVLRKPPSKGHIANIKYWSGQMIDTLGHLHPSQIDLLTIEDYCSNATWSPSTRAGAWRHLGMCLRWLRSRGLIKTDVIEKMEPVHDGDAPKEILTVAEMEHLMALTAGDDLMRLYLVVGGFAGIRPEEMMRMDARSLDLAGGHIHVSETVIKQSPGALPRSVSIEPVLLANLPKSLPKEGKLIQASPSTIARRRLRLVKKMAEKFGDKRWAKWPHDCLRHSFGTYLYATKKDIGYVSFQLGHRSTYITAKHYVRHIEPKDAEAWNALARQRDSR